MTRTISKPLRFTLLAAVVMAVLFLSSRMSSASTLGGGHADLTRAMEALSEHTNRETAAAFSLALILLGREEEFETGQLLAATLVVSSGITAGLKYIVDRRRPTPPNERKNSSFPSGHATASFALATVMAKRYPRLAVPAYLFAGSVTYSRLYLRRHYPTDVLAGALIGIVTAEIATRYDEHITIEGRGLIGAIIDRDRVGLAINF